MRSASAAGSETSQYYGGGSGGSVAIMAGRFEGTGTVAADGRDYTYTAAGGAGGRLAVYAGTPAFIGSLQARGGVTYGESSGDEQDGTIEESRFVPGSAGAPTDSDGDGVFDNISGNGRKDFADIVLYFNQMT